MMADDLSAPLGQGTRAKRHMRRTARITIAALSGLGAVFAGWALMRHDPFGAAPVAIAPVSPVLASSGSKGAGLTGGDAAEPSGDHARNSPLEPAGHAAAHPPLARTVTIIDGTNGTRREVVLPGTASVIDVDEASSDTARRGASARSLGAVAPPR
jgi:uncharacterized protein